MVVGEQAVAFDHHDVQSVMRVVQDAGVATVEQVIEHALRALADLRHGHAFVKILLGIQMAEAANALGGVRQTRAGEAPGTHRRTNQ